MADPQPQPAQPVPAPKPVATRAELEARLEASESNNTLQYLGVAFVSLALAFVVLKGLDYLATSSQPKIPKAPKMPERCVFRPEFETDAGTYAAGSAFGIRLPSDSRRLMVTALNLIKDASATNLAAKLKSVALKNAFDEEQSLGAAQGALMIETAGIYPGLDQAGDIAAVWATADTFFETLPLAAKNPEKGESVWLFAAAKNAPGQKLHRAVVDGVSEGVLVYWFDNGQLDLTGTGGAPLVNGAGEVVGIALGGGVEDGKLSGFGNPVDRFRGPLTEAAPKPEAPGKVESKKATRPPPPK